MLPLIREGKGAKLSEPAGPPQPCVSQRFPFVALSRGPCGRPLRTSPLTPTGFPYFPSPGNCTGHPCRQVRRNLKGSVGWPPETQAVMQPARSVSVMGRRLIYSPDGASRPAALSCECGCEQ